MRHLLVILAVGVTAATLIAACSSGDDVTPAGSPTPVPSIDTSGAVTPPPIPQVTDPATGNYFTSGNFESGRGAWFSLKPPDFTLSDAQAHSPSHSALLRMRDGTDVSGAKVYYLLQEVSPQQFPDYVSGWYRVENWKKGTPKQYIQFVVIAFDAGNNPLPGVSNYQIRYPLAGISDKPFAIGNAQFVFITKEEPVPGEWVHFERNIKQDFIDQWGSAPSGASKLRILFEVRFDDKAVGEGPAEADVYYDDLYIGPNPQ